MATAETARLIASLELQDKNFTRGIKQVEKGVDRVDRKLGAFSGFVNRNVGRAIDSLAVRVVGSVGTGLEEMATLEDAATSVAGAISQVGPAWTTTADDIVAAANRIESETDAAFDDKAIVQASETLIRYGKVSEKNLVPAMEVMTDLAARTGDVESAATLLAKALADPEKAAGKLARAGVILTKEQQQQIKAMVKAGDVTGAQTLMLTELEKTTRGAAAASRGPYRDALNKLGDAGEDLRRGFVTGLAPAILEVTDLLTTELAKPSTIKALKDVGVGVGGALEGIVGIAKSLPWETIGTSLQIAGTGARAVLDAFLGLPPWIQTAVLTGWGLNKLTGGAVTDIFGKVLGKGIDMFAGRGGTPANPLFVADVTGGGGLAGGGGKGLVGKLITGLKLAIPAAIAVGAVEIARENISASSTAQAKGVHQTLNNMLANNPTLGGMLTALRATETGIRQIESNPLNVLVQGEALDELRAMKAQLQKRIEAEARPKINARAPANAAANQASIASREGGGKNTAAELQKIQEQARAGVTATKNAQSIASRENSAQKAELGNIKNSLGTMDANQRAAAVAAAATAVLQGTLQAARDAINIAAVRADTTRTTGAVRSNAVTVAASMSAAASRIVGAVNALDLSVNVTTVNRTSTINNRYGPSGGSSTTNRSGELE